MKTVMVRGLAIPKYKKPGGKRSWTKNYGPVTEFNAQQVLAKAGLWPYKRPPLDMHDWNDDPVALWEGDAEGMKTLLGVDDLSAFMPPGDDKLEFSPEGEPFDLFKELDEAEGEYPMDAPDPLVRGGDPDHTLVGDPGLQKLIDRLRQPLTVADVEAGMKHRCETPPPEEHDPAVKRMVEAIKRKQKPAE